MVLTDSQQIPRARCYLGYTSNGTQHFSYGANTLYGQAFKPVHLCLYSRFTSPAELERHVPQPRTCNARRLSHRYGLASSAFARHYSRNHYCFLFLRVLRCFTSPRSLHTPYTFRCRSLPITGSGVPPFGHPRIKVRLSTPRGLSQIPTSFFGSSCQGIHRVPLKT